MHGGGAKKGGNGTEKIANKEPSKRGGTIGGKRGGNTSGPQCIPFWMTTYCSLSHQFCADGDTVVVTQACMLMPSSMQVHYPVCICPLHASCFSSLLQSSLDVYKCVGMQGTSTAGVGDSPGLL